MRYFAIAAGFAFAITAMFALGPAKAETLKSDGKCWLNANGNRNPEWAACPKEAKVVKVAHRKGSAKVEAAKP
jgi:hypothetical protein